MSPKHILHMKLLVFYLPSVGQIYQTSKSVPWFVRYNFRFLEQTKEIGGMKKVPVV